MTARSPEPIANVHKIYEQQKYTYDNHTHSVPDRIASVSQLVVRPIVRGKAREPVEFGIKLDTIVSDGWTKPGYNSFNAYSKVTKIQEMIDNFHRREDTTPAVLWQTKSTEAARISATAKNGESGCQALLWEDPQKGEGRNKVEDYQNECERVEVERIFTLGKRKCGMAFKRSAVRSRLSPPRVLKTIGFQDFFLL